MSTTSGLAVALMFLGFIVAILWIFLPFAVFSIKNKIDKAIDELQKTQKLLTEIRDNTTPK